jgi:hypothetical protein
MEELFHVISTYLHNPSDILTIFTVAAFVVGFSLMAGK